MRRCFLLALTYVVVVWTTTFALTEEGIALLEIKVGLNDTKNSLGSWKASDESPCKWRGIYCQPNSGRVISINLPYTHLGGFIPPAISKLASLQRLALHHNTLHGSIPEELTKCTELRALYLRGNSLEGGIPSSIGNLSHLSILDLSSNSLKGAIPASLGLLSRLRHLNLSNNFFNGEIPDFGPLISFGNISFAGNSDLCGRQVSKPCRTSMGYPVVLPHAGSDKAAVPLRRNSSYSHPVTLALMITLSLTIAVLLALLCVCVLSNPESGNNKYTEVKKQHQSVPATRLITFQGDLPYPSSEIVEMLQSLEEDDVVGCGGYGTVYRMLMKDNACFAVKKIDRRCEVCDDAFETEVEVLGSVDHQNLVKLRAYCRIHRSKFLIYDYVAMGSLESVIDSPDMVMGWTDRLRVAAGAARGLAYLHHDCSPTIVHSNVKSSNILLDQHVDALVSDYGLGKLLVDEDAHVTTVVAGTFAYLAPEYLLSGVATCKADVYSFGVVLLELMIGRRPKDGAFVRSSVVVDERCADVDAESVDAMLQIVRDCTDADPDRRPTMNEVLHLLEQLVSLHV